MARPPLPDALRVLYVEDDRGAQELVEAILPARWERNIARTTSEARVAMSRHDYDVVLLDIRLEARDGGLKLFEQMDKLGYWDGACAIAVTAYALPGDHERFLEAGFNAYVAKPYTRNQLLGAIAGVIQ